MNFQVEGFFLRIARPLSLLAGVVLYALGVGISRYLGHPLDWGVVILGQVWVTTYQLGSHFLTAYFHLPARAGNRNLILISKENDKAEKYIRRDLILSAAFTAFVATAMLAFIAIRTDKMDSLGLLVMAIMFLVTFSFSVPPIQLVKTGYGELLQSIILVNFIPALAFILQYGELHRLVAMSTFPLTLLHVATVLALQFPEYAADLRKENITLLTYLGWERGLVLQNLLILSSFFLLGLAMLFGLSSRVAAPVFFVLPLGLFQIWYMVRIASGAKPNWRLLTTTALLNFGLAAYLMAFSYWIR
jgi:1,4-dihydroxy-2-naphthoate octaprenyltransferase